MQNKNDYREERFDAFLNKTIILTAKKFYKEKKTQETNELTILNDDYYNDLLQDYVSYTDNHNDYNDIEDFINYCENELVCALKSLSDIERRVIFLLIEKKLKSSEASVILKICSDSVTRIKKRAINKIKKLL